MSGHLRKGAVHHKAVAVLHEHVAGEAEPGRRALRFAGKHRFRVRRRPVGPIRALLSSKVHLHVPASRANGRVLFILGPEALHRGPGLKERAVHGEVILREKTPAPRFCEHPLEETARHLMLEEPVLVLGEARGVEGRIGDVHVKEPLSESLRRRRRVRATLVRAASA